MDITEILLNAQAMDGTVREEAETNLKELQQQSLPLFLVYLALEMKNDEKPCSSRKLAGIILKNNVILENHWTSLDNILIACFKASLLRAIAFHSLDVVSLVIAKVASIELPRDNWPELLPSLSIINQLYAPQATLKTLRYICEDVSPSAWYKYRNEIITEIVVSFLERNNCDVRLAAIMALNSALVGYPDSSLQRVDVMEIVFEAIFSRELKIRQAAFECLVTICSKFYYELEPYILNFAAIPREAVIRDEETVALQAIEVWISICQQEVSIIRKSLSYRSSRIKSYIRGEMTMFCRTNTLLSRTMPCYHIVKKTLHYLVPVLFEALEKALGWELIKAAFICLQLVNQIVRCSNDDDGYIIHLALKFTEKNKTRQVRLRLVASFVYRLILLQDNELVFPYNVPSFTRNLT